MVFDSVRLLIILKMKLHPINVGNFKLDGGAMFGVVPKALWNKTNPANEKNLIDIASVSYTHLTLPTTPYV